MELQCPFLDYDIPDDALYNLIRVFFKNFFCLPDLTPDRLLKMGIFASMYGSPDVAMYCLELYDKQKGTNILQKVSEFFLMDKKNKQST